MKTPDETPIIDLVLAQSLTGKVEPGQYMLQLVAAYRREIERRVKADIRRKQARFMAN